MCDVLAKPYPARVLMADGSETIKTVTLTDHLECVRWSAARIADELGMTERDKRVLEYAAILHDLGKCHPYFMMQIKERDRLPKQAEGQPIMFRHEVSSVLFIDNVPEDIRRDVAFVILSHHKSLDSILDPGSAHIEKRYHIKYKPSAYSSRWSVEWMDTAVNLVLESFYGYFPGGFTAPSEERCKEILQEFQDATKPGSLGVGCSRYKSVFIMADYLSSAFPDKGVLDSIFSRILFKDPGAYNLDPGNPEYYLANVERKHPERRHMITIAPTGCGKTRFAVRNTRGRFFMLLPFQGPINHMQHRLSHVFDYVGLKHGALSSTGISPFMKRLSRLFGLPASVRTPNQLYPLIYRSKGYEIIKADIEGKDVIIDEIHTYIKDGDTNWSMIELLTEILNELGCRIHFTTATMPKAFIKRLLDILGEDNVEIVELDKNTLLNYKRHRIHTLTKWSDAEICSRLKQALDDESSRVLIIRNTIDKARETYKAVADYIGADKVSLIHSAFKRGDRLRLEETLTTNPTKVLVATQVVEVSLDIDYDVLFTDNADIMPLVQRFGRINRPIKNLGKVIRDIYVIKEPAIKSKGGKYFLPYNEERYSRTFNALKNYDGLVINETDVQTLIDTVYPDCSDNIPRLYDPRCVMVGDTGHKVFNVNEYSFKTSREEEYDNFRLVLESDVDEYLRHKDQTLEIPVSQGNLKKVHKTPISEYITDNYFDIWDINSIFVIENRFYDNKIGLLWD